MQLTLNKYVSYGGEKGCRWPSISIRDIRGTAVNSQYVSYGYKKGCSQPSICIRDIGGTAVNPQHVAYGCKKGCSQPSLCILWSLTMMRLAKKRIILWIKEGLQSTLKPFSTRRRESPLTVRILSSNSHGRFQRLADPKLILRHDPEVVLVAFDQPHDLEVEVTDELADRFPFSCLHVLLLHNVVGDWAPTILLATHPDIILSSSFFI